MSAILMYRDGSYIEVFQVKLLTIDIVVPLEGSTVAVKEELYKDVSCWGECEEMDWYAKDKCSVVPKEIEELYERTKSV